MVGGFIEQLSGGEKRRVALCRLLLNQPDMLLLDEPTNHLDAESVAWLENHLEQYKGTVIAVTHDRYFLDNVAGWILEWSAATACRIRATILHGWSRRNNGWRWKSQTGCRAQDSGARTRVAGANPKARQAKARRACGMTNWPRSESRSATRTTKFISRPARAWAIWCSRRRDHARVMATNLLFDSLSFAYPPGAIVGIVGPNGAGKTTLFRMLTGSENCGQRRFRMGPTVKLAYVDQSRQTLDDKKTVWAEISGGQDIMRVDNYETPRAPMSGASTSRARSSSS